MKGFNRYRIVWTEFDGRGGEQDKMIDFFLPEIALGHEKKYIWEIMGTLENACADPKKLKIERMLVKVREFTKDFEWMEVEL